MRMQHVVVVEPVSPLTPVGCIYSIFEGTPLPEGVLPADGAYLECDKYPQLYAIIGDAYCPKEIHKQLPLTVFQKLKRFLTIPYQQKTVMETNPGYVEGSFRLPDFRPYWYEYA